MFQKNDTTAVPRVTANTDVASGNAAVITLNAITDNYHTIDWVGGGYYGTPDANSAMLIQDTTLNTVLFQSPVVASGPVLWQFGIRGLQAPKDSAVTVSLDDGSQIKDLCIQYR